MDDTSFGEHYWRLPLTPPTDLQQLSAVDVDSTDFRRLADNLPSLCWIANADGYIVWYNRRWHQYCGTSSEQMEGHGWQSVHDPAVLPSVIERWEGAIAKGETFEMVFPLRGADGEYRPFLTRIIPLRNEAGVVGRWIGNNVDISEQRAAENDLLLARDELRLLNQTLEQEVLDRTTRHLETEERLRQSQKLEAIGQLTGGVAHDFNNLLTVIRGSIDLLRRSDVSEEKRARYIDAIGDTADRAAKLTGQLLAFARRQSLLPTCFDVGESLREVAGMVSTLAGSRIQLQVQVPTDVYHILVDRSQFDTAIVNMCLNARDAMNGEGQLTIAVGPVSGIPVIRSHPPVVGDFIAVTITDTGEGISPETAERIFEPFFTTKNVGQGTGLGLSQVFGFAKQSGGDVRVDSASGKGATFTLYLPRTDPDISAGAVVKEVVSAADGAGICVLVVEDNDQVGAFATQALRELGFDSVMTIDGKAALAELEKDCARFHVVFSDVVMPGMSGLDLADQIRERYPDVPVVLTSGYSHVLAQNGQHGFKLLHKPYSIEQLAHVLLKAVAWSRSGRR